MGITLKSTKLESKSRSSSAGTPLREPKPRYTNLSLPFKDPARNLKIWQTQVLAAITDWAGTLENPFGANSHEDFEAVVTQHFKMCFPDIDVTPAVLSLVRTSLLYRALLFTALAFFL